MQFVNGWLSLVYLLRNFEPVGSLTIKNHFSELGHVVRSI